MRVLVISHVDERWIKQRPHFMAEALEQLGCTVTFAFARAYNRENLGTDSVSCRSIPMWCVPNALRSRVRPLDRLVQGIWALLLVLTRPEVVWLTSPRLNVAARLVARFTSATLVYDHMDRHSAFDSASEFEAHDELVSIDSADLVLASSPALVDDVRQFKDAGRVVLVRNALQDPERWQSSDGPQQSEQGIVLGYVGTVSSWFDWSLVLAVLETEGSWSIKVWGPADVDVPSHPRVTHLGIVSHMELPTLLATCDVLVMPFELTPLIEGVDPVKAYEYLATSRGVVLPRYAATEQFRDHARLYEPGDPESFRSAIKRASIAAETPARRAFVRESTWGARAELAVAAIRDLP